MSADPFDLKKTLPNVWADLFSRKQNELAAIAALVGYLAARESNDQDLQEHFRGLAFRAMKTPRPPISENQECSFCNQSGRPLVAGSNSFICAECANLVLESLQSDKK